MIPPAPGVLCADGLLAADLKAEFSRTLAARPAPIDVAAADAIFAELDAQARGVARRGRRRAGESRSISRVALMRYHGQGGEIADRLGRRRAEATEAAFAAAHQALYGFTL